MLSIKQKFIYKNNIKIKTCIFNNNRLLYDYVYTMGIFPLYES